MSTSSSARMVPVAGREVRLSSPDRVLWPTDAGSPAVTKSDLADYVVAVADRLIPALTGRPLTLQRFPTGLEGEMFYSKNPPRGVPEWMRTATVTYPSGRSHAQLVIDSAAGAVWAVQMSTLTFHPWPVTTADPDNPNEIRIDLDPQPARSFADLVTVARATADLLTELGLTSFVKTSGSRGLHVFAPIRPEYEFLDVRHGVIGIGRELERRLPGLVTTAWWKEERGEAIFIDYNQACRDRTMASPYSPRALPGAPVSMPVTWSDLGSVSPTDFTIRTAPGHIASTPDPWAGFSDAAASFAPALGLWHADLDRGLGELVFPPDYPKMPDEPPRVQPSKRRTGRD